MNQRIQIVTGHYGSGKTEYAVNLALSLAAKGEKTAMADMDIVNPYFRSYEQGERLREAGVRMIVTSCGGTTDLPAVPAEVMTIFEDESYRGVLDIGGDPVGARVLARFAPKLKRTQYDLLFVLNANRPETSTLEGAKLYMESIEIACDLKVTGIVNNTHLCRETTPAQILKGAKLAEALSKETGLPVVHHVVERQLWDETKCLFGEDAPLFPIEIYMTKPWEENNEEDNQLWPVW